MVHAIVVPYPLQGHVTPAVHLALKLASSGFTVTFLTTEHVHRHLSSDPFSSSLPGLDIRHLTIPDGLPLSLDRSLHHDLFMSSLLHRLPSLVLSYLRPLLSSSSDPPSLLVADTFFVWPSSVARSLRLTHVSFWTEPALVFSLYHHLHLLPDLIDHIPGVPSLHPSDLPSYLQDPHATSVVHQIIRRAFQQAKDADFVLCNTVHELEEGTILALNDEKPFYAIGPVFPCDPAATHVPTSFWIESDCTQWLNKAREKEDHVLYVSFGSYAHLSKRDLTEIAMGILDSGVTFVWVLRPDIVSSEEPDPLPKEFVDGSKERGLTVPWCRQAEVLNHPAVEGFLTHCGWNSILESVWAGVPMMCFPLLTDQFTNRKLVVKDWGAGVGIGELGEVGREEVAKVVRYVLGEGGCELRRKVEVLRRRLKGAVGEGGSSCNNFERFVRDVMDHVKGRV